MLYYIILYIHTYTHIVVIGFTSWLHSSEWLVAQYLAAKIRMLRHVEIAFGSEDNAGNSGGLFLLDIYGLNLPCWPTRAS